MREESLSKKELGLDLGNSQVTQITKKKKKLILGDSLLGCGQANFPSAKEIRHVIHESPQSSHRNQEQKLYDLAKI